ncbi:MAG: hypothetical protein OEZ48_07880 [Candidatus Bathyarchaeota archaeon]|nr:hypothetical protein [Candidatus Bathyarchaeota archaeon]
MGHDRAGRELRRWLENIDESQKEMLLEALQEGSLLKSAFWRDVEGFNPPDDLQTRELKEMGIKLEGLFQDIEPETIKTAKDYAEFCIGQYENYCKRIQTVSPERFERLVEIGECDRDGTLEEETRWRQLRMGVSLKAFEISLQHLQIPYVLNDPLVDWRPESEKEPEDEPSTKLPFDFWVPLVGRIDIRNATPENPQVNISVDAFNRENPHYVIAYQVLDMIKPRWLKLSGFMYRSEVKKEYEPVHLADRPFYSIPIEDFESKHDAQELCNILLIARNMIKNIVGPSD